MVLGEHCDPEISDDAAEENNTTLFLSRVRPLIASATDEFGTSVIASTPCWSYQSRAMASATSGLFW